MKSKILGLLAVALLVGPMAANAINWSFQYVDVATEGLNINASGTFMTTDTLVGGYYTITALSGMRNGDVMSLIAPGGFQANTNLFSPASPFLDFGGLSFAAGSTNFNVYWGGSDYRECESPCSNPVESDPVVRMLVSQVPEPGTLALLGLGLTGLGFSRRRKLN